MRVIGVLFSTIFFCSCAATSLKNAPEIKASADEAVVKATVIDYKELPTGKANCGSTHCFALVQIDSVIEVGKGFPLSFDAKQPILAFFSFGLDGADSTTHNGLNYTLEKIKSNNRFISTLKPVDKVEGQQVYQVDLYKKLR